MATFNDLRHELRTTKLVEAPTEFYGDVQLLEWLRDASRELAAAFRFPRRDAQQDVSAGTTRVSLDEPPVDVMGVAYNGVGLARRSYRQVRFYQGWPQAVWPRAWFFDAFTGGPIEIGPAPAAAGSVDVQYVGDPYDGPITGGTPVWGGLFEPFHELVLLRAAVKAFEMGFEFEESRHYLQRYQLQLQEFTQFLGISAPPTVGQGDE